MSKKPDCGYYKAELGVTKNTSDKKKKDNKNEVHNILRTKTKRRPMWPLVS